MQQKVGATESDHSPGCGMHELERAGLTVGTESHRDHLYRAAVCFENDGQRGAAVAIYDALIVLYTNTLQSSWALNKAAQLYESMGLFQRAARAYERHTRVGVSERPSLLQKAMEFRLALEHDRKAEADATLLIKLLLARGQKDRAAAAALALLPVYRRRGLAAERGYLRLYLRRFGRRSSKKTTVLIRARLAELRWGKHQDWRKVFDVREERRNRKRQPPEMWEPVFSTNPVIDRANIIETHTPTSPNGR